MKIVILLSIIFIVGQTSCLNINTCDESSSDYSQFVAFSIMKCYYRENNHDLANSISELTDEDWLIFTMFLNQYTLLCNYYRIINNINGITSSIQEIKKIQDLTYDTLQELKFGLSQIDLISFNFTKALSVYQISLLNQQERLKRYSNISITLEYIQRTSQTQQQEQNNNLNTLLSLAMSMNIIFENCTQEMIRFYSISSLALLLLFQFSFKQTKYLFSVLPIALSELYFHQFINPKFIRYNLSIEKVYWVHIDINVHHLLTPSNYQKQKKKPCQEYNLIDKLQIKARDIVIFYILFQNLIFIILKE